MLRHPELRAQYAAAFGLVEMQAIEAIAALEAFSRSQSRQNQVYFEKLANTLKGHDKSHGSALKKQVQDLSEKMRQLDAKSDDDSE